MGKRMFENLEHTNMTEQKFLQTLKLLSASNGLSYSEFLETIIDVLNNIDIEKLRRMAEISKILKNYEVE